MPEVITSPANPKVKSLLALQQKSSARRESGLFVVEGRRELRRCADAGFDIEAVFVCPALYPGAECFGAKVFEVGEAVYRKIAMREGTEGIVAEVRMRERRIGTLALSPAPLVVVLESVEKPGNLGAVLRSADAAGADAVLVCDPLTDLWNPNLIRASAGAVFSVPCVSCASQDAIDFLRAHGIRILTAQLQDSSLYTDCDMSGGTALVMGTESTGLTERWRAAADAHIRIPMLGAVDSLNVSVSAAVLLYEAVRQRQAGRHG